MRMLSALSQGGGGTGTPPSFSPAMGLHGSETLGGKNTFSVSSSQLGWVHTITRSAGEEGFHPQAYLLVVFSIAMHRTRVLQGPILD